MALGQMVEGLVILRNKHNRFVKIFVRFFPFLKGIIYVCIKDYLYFKQLYSFFLILFFALLKSIKTYILIYTYFYLLKFYPSWKCKFIFSKSVFREREQHLLILYRLVLNVSSSETTASRCQLAWVVLASQTCF